MPKKLTTEEVRERMTKSTNGEYTLLGEYINAHAKTLVRHNTCGNVYEVAWNNFQQGGRCPRCSGLEKLNNEEIDRRIKELTNGEYIRLGEYTRTHAKMLVEHNVCNNKYMVTWGNFRNGKRCPKCLRAEKLDNKKIDERIFELVRDEYIRLGEYVGSGVKMLIKHTLCETKYEVAWDNFKQGKRCPRCKESKGEKSIADILNSLNIKHTSQKRFEECKYKKTLPFDFYINNKKSKLLIEFDGIQHFKPIEVFGGKEALKDTQLRDKIKNNYAKENNIPLLRIPYTEQNNIEKILTEKLKELNFI